MGAEHGDRALRHLVDLVDEHGALVAQGLDDMFVVDDLVAHIDRRPVDFQGALDNRNRPLDAGAYDCVVMDLFGPICTTSEAAALTVLTDCPADFDNTGAVAAFALAILLGTWAPHPNPPAAHHADAQGTPRHTPPAASTDLCIAQAINTYEQETAGYARTVGAGETQREARGAGLTDARNEATGYLRVRAAAV